MDSPIVLIGNCQAQLMEAVMGVAQPLRIQRMPPNFTMTDGDKEETLRKLEAARFIFIQRASDEFHLKWLQSREVAERFPGKTWVWPNIYFDGYFPRTRYIYLKGGGKLLSPLDEYHLHPILEAFKAGETITRAVERLQAGPADTSNPFEESLANLRSREQGVTVELSDFIAEEVVKTKCFYTPNHPHTYLLVEMARRLAQAADIPFNEAKAKACPYKLDKIDIAPFPWVAHRQSLAFESSETFRGQEVTAVNGREVTIGKGRTYTAHEIAESFYRIYRSALPL